MTKISRIIQQSVAKISQNRKRSKTDFIAFSPGQHKNMSKVRRYSTKNINVSGAVHSLLETLSDKDEGVRESIERSLVRMCKRRPNETMEIICNYRQKTAKLPEAHVAVYLR